MCVNVSVAVPYHRRKYEVSCKQWLKICIIGRVLVRNFVIKCIMWVGNVSLALYKNFR